MGDLHGVKQLKPRIILGGAILKIKKEKEETFLEKYPVGVTSLGELGIFDHTFMTISDDGIVERYAMYYEDKVIDFKTPGIYVQVRGQSKHGPNRYDYVDFMSNLSPYLEDVLFYVHYCDDIDQYEIKDGVLYFKDKGKFDEFDDYLILDHASSPEIIADFYIEKINELLLFHNELIENGENPNAYYDQEDYEDLLNKINNYKDYISIEKFKELEDWLKIQINYYQ